MNSRQLLVLALGLIILFAIGVSLSSIKTVKSDKSIASTTAPTSQSSTPSPTVTGPAPASSSPKPDLSTAQPSVVTTLPASNMPSAPIKGPTTLLAGWNKSYAHYQYPDGLTPDYHGVPVTAYIAGGNQKIQMQPNQMGTFPRLFLDQNAQVQVTLQFPQNSPGDRVGVTTLDGGHLGQSDSVQILTLNADRAASFEFTLSENPGVSRVAVQNGVQTTTLDFWAGPNNKFPQIVSTNSK